MPHYFKKHIDDNSVNIILIFIILIYSIFIFFIGWSRHYGFLTSINDLGHYDQAIWGITQKGYLLNSSQFNMPINKLGFHFDPVLYLFSILYFIKPTANWLIIVQSLSLSLSAWPIFRLAKHYCQSDSAAILWSLAYLFNPFLLNAATWDFHPVVLAVPFVALAALATEKARFPTLLIACFFIMSCKEHFGLMVAGFGFLWAFKHREFLKPSILVSLGILHFILVFNYVMPAFSPTGGHVMMSSQMGQLSRYAWLGSSITEILQTLLRHPVYVIENTLLNMGGLLYLSLLILPFLGLPLLGACYLIPSLGDLAANLLSSNPMPRGIWAYHSAADIPLFCAAAIKGSHSLWRWKKHLSRGQLAGIVLIAGMIFGYAFTTLPLPRTYNFWQPNNLLNPRDPSLGEILKIIGPRASVSAQANIGAHFSQREEIFSFPNKVGEADIVILRLESPTGRIMPQLVGSPGTLAGHLQLDPNQYLAQILEMLEKGQHGIVYWNDPWLVFGRGQESKHPTKPVKAKILELRKTWNDNRLRKTS